MTESVTDRWAVPVALTMCIYGALGGGLWGVNEYFADEQRRAIVEMEFFEPEPPKPKPKLVEPEPPPPPDPDPEPEPPKEPPKKIAKLTKERVRQPPPNAPPPPDIDEPAPGENVNDDDIAPRRVYRLPDQGPGGTIPVARGRSTGKTGGVEGGTGTNTGGGGDPGSKGTGVKPVSITALKKKPMPKGGQDFSKLKQPIESEVVIKVRVLVDERGKVARATIVKKADEKDLNAIALELARKLLFEPALDQNDEPVATQIVWTFRFTPG